jgi:hypothetical protein
MRFHAERHAYAQKRYADLVGCPCPVGIGVGHGRPHLRYLMDTLGIDESTARTIDHVARRTIAEELGHWRPGVTNAYLG